MNGIKKMYMLSLTLNERTRHFLFSDEEKAIAIAELFDFTGGRYIGVSVIDEAYVVDECFKDCASYNPKMFEALRIREEFSDEWNEDEN